MILTCICISLLCCNLATLLLLFRVYRLESWCKRISRVSSSIAKGSCNG